MYQNIIRTLVLLFKVIAIDTNLMIYSYEKTTVHSSTDNLAEIKN